MKAAHAGVGAVVLMLVVTGVAGTIYKIMAPNGWLADAFHRSTTAGLALTGTLGLLGLFAWITRGSAMRWRNRQAAFFVYAFAAAGLVYLARFWIHGSL